jgi:hypothetical protein
MAVGQSDGPIGQAMAAALRSPFGVGDSQFHYEGEAREVESVYLGVYRTDAFRRVGCYNTALLRTEDDDLNARIRAAGMKIWLDPAIRSTYLCRNRLSDIWRQYFGYGYWKVGLASVRRDALRARHMVPALFVTAAGVGGYAEELRGLLRSSISRVGTIRYDAFSDMGGRLSFSTALLDEHGDGVVVTSINGRTETRTYAKPLVGGQSPHNLSEEEEAAVRDAMSLAGRTQVGQRPRARSR